MYHAYHTVIFNSYLSLTLSKVAGATVLQELRMPLRERGRVTNGTSNTTTLLLCHAVPRQIAGIDRRSDLSSLQTLDKQETSFDKPKSF